MCHFLCDTPASVFTLTLRMPTRPMCCLLVAPACLPLTLATGLARAHPPAKTIASVTPSADHDQFAAQGTAELPGVGFQLVVYVFFIDEAPRPSSKKLLTSS